MFVAVDGADDILLSGFFNGKITFGGELFDSQQGIACFVAKLDPGGAHVASNAFGMNGYAIIFGVAAGPKSVAIAGGSFAPIDFGAGMIGQTAIADPIVATFAP
jgi:hypothetical protein